MCCVRFVLLTTLATMVQLNFDVVLGSADHGDGD